MLRSLWRAVKATAQAAPVLVRLTAPVVVKVAIARGCRFLALPLAYVVCIVLTPAGRQRLFKWMNSHLSEEALLKKHPWLRPPKK